MQAVPLELPPDLTDNFAAAAWKNHHSYLDQDYRNNISSFRMTNSETVDKSVKRLSSDLESCRWEQLYGNVQQLDSYNAGYFFIVAR